MLGGQDLLEILQTAGIHPLPGSGKSNIVSNNQVSETGNVWNAGLKSEIHKDYMRKKWDRPPSQSIKVELFVSFFVTIGKEMAAASNIALTPESDWPRNQIWPPACLEILSSEYFQFHASQSQYSVSLHLGCDWQWRWVSRLEPSPSITIDTDNTWLILITPDSLTHIKSLFNMAYVKMFFC